MFTPLWNSHNCKGGWSTGQSCSPSVAGVTNCFMAGSEGHCIPTFAFGSATNHPVFRPFPYLSDRIVCFLLFPEIESRACKVSGSLIMAFISGWGRLKGRYERLPETKMSSWYSIFDLFHTVPTSRSRHVQSTSITARCKRSKARAKRARQTLRWRHPCDPSGGGELADSSLRVRSF